jgi:hypothetical protein
METNMKTTTAIAPKSRLVVDAIIQGRRLKLIAVVAKRRQSKPPNGNKEQVKEVS